MEATTLALIHSRTTLPCLTYTNRNFFSFSHFSKHVYYSHSQRSPKPVGIRSPSSTLSLGTKSTAWLTPIKCSYSNTASSNPSQNPFLKPFKTLNSDGVKTTLSTLTPFDIIKWSGILSIVAAATKWTVNFAFNPFVWMYFSWTWLFWPWFVAIALAVYGLYCFRRHSLGEANIFEQLAIVTSVFTWLTLVPSAHFNGYLEGWPFVFCFVYHYFFFYNVSVRKRLYGDFYARKHDPKWDINPPKLYQFLFCVGVMIGHWLAAFEGPELHRIPGGWNNLGVWIMIVVALLMQYDSTLYLAKYSEKVVVPTAVVQFGPYRWVRHPIYASTMLLFVTYCLALRAPLSSLFVVAVCLLYYGEKAKMEEALMVENFGEGYLEYAKKVRHKLIPFVY